MKEMLKSILKSSGYELQEMGNWIVAYKNDVRINIGFLTKETFDPRELEGLKGKKIVIPVDDSQFDDIKDVVVVDRKDLYDDFTRIVLGEKDFDSSTFYKLVAAEESWDDITVERLGDSDESIIKPVMMFEDVVELSKKTVEGFRYVLELVPHHLFRFDCELDLEKESIRKSGLISVNALTKKCEIWKRNFETVDLLEHAHKKLEPKISESEALELARRFGIEESTTVIESVSEKEHTVVMEKKKVGPSENDFSIKDEGLFYLPIWCIEGTNGVMIIDAAAGKIIEEDYYVK